MAEDGTLKNVISNLKKDLECPVCLQVVKKPFKVCERGHLVCVGCLNHLKSCPTCQGDFVLENPVCIKNILEHLPRHCQHSCNGCSKIVEDNNSHEKFCRFRIIKYRICPKDVLVNELLDHIKKDHQINMINPENKKKRCLDKFIQTIDFTVPHLVEVLNNLFWFTLDNSNQEKELKIIFEVIPMDKLEDDYYVTAKFTNGKFDFRSTMKAAFLEDIEQHNLLEASGKDYRMTIPQTMLPRLIDKDGNLVISELVFFKGE